MAISKTILGMNARNFIYLRRYNSVRAKRLADDKIATKKNLIKNKIPTAALLSVFPDRKSVRSFKWDKLNGGFVIKPARGFGGEGILVFKSWRESVGKNLLNQTYTADQLQSHIYDIMEGTYSLQYLPDTAYTEELIHPSLFFKKFTSIGLPDIRIIVFNKVPVMAMLRIPTLASEGKANLHLGAIGVGIGLRTGITFNAIIKGKQLKTDEFGKKLTGIKIPDWDKILLAASKAQTVCGLGLAGIDVVIDKDRGPLVLEINARPGLSIQIANQSSMRTRLERLESLEVASPERGVELAKSLFAEEKLEKKAIPPIVISAIEKVEIKANGVAHKIEARIDTGADRTSLDIKLAKDLGIEPSNDIVRVRSASGRESRSIIKLSYKLAGKRINSIASVTDRSHLKHQMIIGRRDLRGFLVNPYSPFDKPDPFETEH